MKKTTILILCVILVMTMALSVWATGSVTMTVTSSETAVKQGQSIVFTVSVSEFANCTSGSIEIVFDQDTFIRSDNKWILPGTPVMNVPDGNAVFAYGTGAPTTVSGEIYQFTLTAKEDGHLGAADVGVVIKLKAGDAVSEARQALSITVSCTHEYGTWNSLNDDQHGKTCTKCGDVVKENHTWDGGRIEIQADCQQGGLVIYTCSGCGATKQVTTDKLPHAYDNACDTACNYGCGTTREADHDYAIKWSSDADSHWHQCSVCGDKTDVTHHTPGDPATEWKPQTCTECGYVLQKALGHTHSYETQWTYDEVGHWHECSGCDDLSSYQDHKYDNSCDTTCNICGAVRSIQHTMDANWWFDASGHWQECKVCGEKTKPDAHAPGPEATAESAQTCLDCGYEIAPMLGHTHEFGVEWYFDDTGHWQRCGCGSVSVREPHTWNEGVVSRQPTVTAEGEMFYICTTCDAEKWETIPKLDPEDTTQPTDPVSGDPDPEPVEFQWWILVVIAGVLALGFIAFMIFGAIKGQKQTGRFSEK